jgi:hypothetical protein
MKTEEFRITRIERRHFNYTAVIPERRGNKDKPGGIDMQKTAQDFVLLLLTLLKAGR